MNKSFFQKCLLALGCCILISLVGCKKKTTTETTHPNQTISVSIEPLRWVTEKIAGPDFQVITLVPNGNNPETYEPTPQQMVQLSESRLYFRVGNLGFEQTWLQRLEKNAPETRFFSVSEGIREMASSCQHEGHAHSDHDPHIWTTPQNMQIIAKNICQNLCSIYPEQKQIFQANLERLQEEISQTETTIRRLLQNKKGMYFLIYHPTLTYFAHDYGLHQLSIEEDGKSPSPEQISKLVRLCQEKKIKHILVQQEFDQRNAQIIAQETGAQIAQIHPLAYNWHKEMIQIAKTLSQNE